MPKLNREGLCPQVELSMVSQGKPDLIHISSPLRILALQDLEKHYLSLGLRQLVDGDGALGAGGAGWVLGSLAQPARSTRQPASKRNVLPSLTG